MIPDALEHTKGWRHWKYTYIYTQWEANYKNFISPHTTTGKKTNDCKIVAICAGKNEDYQIPVGWSWYRIPAATDKW